MANTFPYLQTNKRLKDLFAQIKSAAVPAKFSQDLLRKWGFTSTNDRPFIPLLKGLGFLDKNSAPTERYREYRQKGGSVLALGIRELYQELFSIYESAHKESRDNIKGAFSRLTNMDERYVTFMTSTFQSLVELASFSKQPVNEIKRPPAAEEQDEPDSEADSENSEVSKRGPSGSALDFRYNIQIHLPATKEIAVYNAIFKSIKEHLMD